MTREAFRERVAQGALVADGALGTMLALRGVPQPYELATLTHHEVVRALHREYYEAGARLIETNTYYANRVRLLNLPERGGELTPAYSLLEQFGSPDELVRRINQEAVRLARESVGEDALVFGAVGPVGKPLEPMGEVRLEEAEQAFEEQIRALLEGGVDGLILETFIDPQELALAISRRPTPRAPNPGHRLQRVRRRRRDASWRAYQSASQSRYSNSMWTQWEATVS